MKSIIIFFLLTSCAAINSKRKLNMAEQEKYLLNGIINEARICPTVFNEKTKASQIIGNCELVTCEEKNKKTECWAKPEN